MVALKADWEVSQNRGVDRILLFCKLKSNTLLVQYSRHQSLEKKQRIENKILRSLVKNCVRRWQAQFPIATPYIQRRCDTDLLLCREVSHLPLRSLTEKCAKTKSPLKSVAAYQGGSQVKLHLTFSTKKYSCEIVQSRNFVQKRGSIYMTKKSAFTPYDSNIPTTHSIEMFGHDTSRA